MDLDEIRAGLTEQERFTPDLDAVRERVRAATEPQHHRRAYSTMLRRSLPVAASIAAVALLALGITIARGGSQPDHVAAPPTAISTPATGNVEPTTSSESARSSQLSRRTAPTPADITACRTDAPNSPPPTHPWLLCLFVPTGTSTSAGALVIGVVDPLAVNDLHKGLAAHSNLLCLRAYPLWLVAGDVGRRQETGCNDGVIWQNAIDDAAQHTSWTVVDSAPLCAGTSGNIVPAHDVVDKRVAPVRMAVLCRPDATATVLTGATATSLATAAQVSSVGSPCTLAGWSLTTVTGLAFDRVTLPTVNDVSGCRLTSQVQALVEHP